jgi:hypothetical protein
VLPDDAVLIVGGADAVALPDGAGYSLSPKAQAALFIPDIEL